MSGLTRDHSVATVQYGSIHVIVGQCRDNNWIEVRESASVTFATSKYCEPTEPACATSKVMSSKSAASSYWGRPTPRRRRCSFRYREPMDTSLSTYAPRRVPLLSRRVSDVTPKRFD